MNINDSDVNISIKEQKAKTATKCCVEGCEKIGKWHNRLQTYYLQKGMCIMHYKRNYKYGDVNYVQKLSNNGVTKDPSYSIYWGIVARCYNKDSTSYHRYGDRGIKVCDRWLGVYGCVNFIKDMGERPSLKHSIDRIDPNGDYEPSNCRWATIHEQAANTRTNNKVVGVSFYKKKWSAELIVNNVRVLREKFDCFGKAVKRRKQAEKKYNIYGSK